MIFWTLRIFVFLVASFLVGWELITSRYVNWRWQWAVKKQGDPYIFSLRIPYMMLHLPFGWKGDHPKTSKHLLRRYLDPPPKMPKIPFQEVFGCARIVKASKDCNKHSQAFHVGVSTVCKNLRIALDSGWFFVGLHPSHPKATKVCVGHKIFQNATAKKKKQFVFAKETWE